MNAVDFVLRGPVAVLTFANPPVNSLAAPLRQGLASAIDRAVAEDAVKAIVLIGADGKFSAGADIKEFGTPAVLTPPSLRQLIAQVESCEKPIVAAISGNCLGGGLELALGCHYRVAAKDAMLGLPEVKLGLLPGAGGTQRLPRVLGFETALNIIVSGEPVPAGRLAKTPLIDQLAEGELSACAIAFAEQVIAKGANRPRVRDRSVSEPNLEALAQFARNTVKAAFPRFPAPLACIDAVEASAGDFETGLATERRLFTSLMLGPESQALRHAFFAERAAARVADLPEGTPTREIRSAAVIGGGTMGTGIALSCLNVGLPVTLLEVKQDALDKAVARIRETYQGQVKKGRLKTDAAAERLKLLTPTLDYGVLANADIAIEAVFEEMSVKEQVFKALDRVMRAGAILATNTSTLDVDRIAEATRRPADVVGTHFFSPAQVMRLLEVVRGKRTAPDVLATAMRLGKTLKKTAVVSRVCDGFIGNRMIGQYARQAEFMLEEGASPQQVDRAIEAFGFAMGPFRMGDLAGNDISWHIRQRHATERPDLQYSPLLDRLCQAGRFGQKSGAGWYDYRPGDRNAQPSATVDALIKARRKELGLESRRIDDAEVTDRLVYALVNEGAKILDEKIAQRASDIDVVYLTGYGFPVWRGGPMYYADQVGLHDVVRRIKELSRNPHGDPAFWTPAPLLARLAAGGERFNGSGGAA
jgi:3-hydroxyacyl-CoA dehydrogenase